VHGPPRDGEGDKHSDPDKDREVLAEQTDDAGDPGAENLADTDLLGALFGSIGNIDMGDARQMAVKLETVSPHMDDYGNLIGSYALNACVAIYSSLQYLLNRDTSNLYDIGIAYTDTVDFKVQGEEDLTEDEIAAHPDMQIAWNFIIEETRQTS
jgi:hypothetical protein